MAPPESGAHSASLAVRAERLSQIRGLPLRTDVPEIVAILDSLQGEAVTLGALKASKIGVEINDRFLRQHEHPEVRRRSAALVAQWRTLTAGQPPAPTAPHTAPPQLARSGSDAPPSTGTASPPAAEGAPSSPDSSSGPARRPLRAEITAAEYLARCRAAAQLPSDRKRGGGGRSRAFTDLVIQKGKQQARSSPLVSPW
mmetsp:Transcript_79320/g.246004  ORF Transcript_79320/g.246004 Transcript_79320/m.246004 type:complete len:199 (-) Transcript_79320:105-701(-)